MGVVDQVLVATDSELVVDECLRAGVAARLTSAAHVSGTDRVLEVSRLPEFERFDLVVNVQGDEPFIPREAIAGALARVRGGGREAADDIGTAAAPLDPSAAADPARVKVVTDRQGRALYFSRAPIPWWHGQGAPSADFYWQHLGVYAFTRLALERWATLERGRLEEVERLEQLRALEAGWRIGVARLAEPVPGGIDTPEDLRRAEELLEVTERRLP
jgi:3-deoxy-manno-octulosonate cytidylyltransferase (CMP-KDO synthetase)